MFHYYLKNGLFAIAGILFAALVLAIFLWWPEPFLLQHLVRPPQGVNLSSWLDDFQRFHILLLSAPLFVAFLWHLFALINSGRESDDRLLWVIAVAVVGVAAVALTIFFMPRASAGTFWVYFFAVVNAIGAFWLATVLWTPAAHKYDPPGAYFFRRKLRL